MNVALHIILVPCCQDKLVDAVLLLGDAGSTLEGRMSFFQSCLVPLPSLQKWTVPTARATSSLPESPYNLAALI